MSFYTSMDLIKEFCEHLEKKHEEHNSYARKDLTIPTGFESLDALADGLKPGELVLVSGRSGTGKSAFCHNIAAHVAFEKGLPVGIFSFKIKKEELMLRILSSMTGIPYLKLVKGPFDDFFWSAITEAIAKIYGAPFYVNDSREQALDTITDEIARLADRNDKLLIIIDSLQGISGDYPRNKEAREPDTKLILRSLKNIAIKCQIPIVITSRLSFVVVESRPELSDLKMVGIDESMVDTVFFIHRDIGKDIHRMEEHTVDIISAKHKDSHETIKLSFVPALLRFTENKDRK